MSEQEKKRKRIYHLLHGKTKLKNSELVGISLSPPSSPDLNPLDYAICGVLENKTNSTCHRNIDSLKTATENKWYKMLEEFIFKAFWHNKRKNGGHIE